MHRAKNLHGAVYFQVSNVGVAMDLGAILKSHMQDSGDVMADMDRVLESLAVQPIQVVSAETANKSMANLRRETEGGAISVISTHGKIGNETPMLISLSTFAGLVESVVEIVQTQRRNRPASTLLEGLKPTRSGEGQLTLTGRKYDPAVGGRAKLL